MKFILTVLATLMVATSAIISPEQLRCEHMSEPNCIDVKHPRLSWINAPVNDFVKGAAQTAYQIRVSSSKDRLKRPDLWDSGKVISDSSYLIPYAGVDLSSGMECWWQVRVWDSQGNVTRWSEPSMWRMGVTDPDEWKAEWIGAPWHGEKEKMNDTPAPCFRKEFNADKKIARATAFVTGLGYFEFYVNGRKIGDECLVPNFTNYTERPELPEKNIGIEADFNAYRVMYLTYDITSDLEKGENVIGLLVGNGWYNTHTTRWTADFGTPRMYCQVEIDYKDGSSETVVSDTGWKVSESAIIYNDEYKGETFDARRYEADWCTSAYDDSSWKNAVRRVPPTGVMTASSAPLDRVTETLSPMSFRKTESGYEVDFGKEISGWIRFSGVKGHRGDTLQVRYISESPVGVQRYIFADSECSYAPKFAWYVFRKAVITGVSSLSPENLVAEAVNTDVQPDAEFFTSDTLLNKINEIWRRSLLDNLHGCIMSDCPHREKSAYTGDGQVCCETVMYNFDAAAFYTKWIRDMNDSQNPKTGYVPNGAPWQPGCGGGVAWGAAMNIIPWEHFRHFGDISILQDNYDAMKNQLEYMTTWITPDGTMLTDLKDTKNSPGWSKYLNLGDWVPAYELPPTEIVHTYFLWYCADITSKAARALGHDEDSVRYAALADEVRNAFHRKFYDSSLKTYGDYGSNVFALAMGVPEDVREDVVSSWEDELRNKYSSHLNTGIFGTRLLFETLARYGLNDLAYDIITQRDFPGFGHWIAQGATTTWECWDGSNSRNHPMYGGGLTWMYSTLAGVKVDESCPGFKHVIIKPLIVKELEKVHYSKMTPQGLLSSTIDHHDGHGTLKVTIPVGSTADVYLPDGSCQELIQGTYVLKF